MKKSRLNIILKFWLIVCVLIAMINTNLFSQDLHFSQFFNSPLSTNPANTGFIPASDYRLGAHYREQWANISAKYKTVSIYGDFQFLRDLIPSGWLGLGGLILQDVAGSGSLKSTKVYTSLAYHQMIGISSLLSAGFNVGYAAKQINISNLRFGDQWDGHFFSAPTGEIIQNNSIGYIDLQAGLNYAYFPTDNLYVHTGFSIHHLNRPKESFFAITPGYDNRIPSRSIFFADAAIKLNNSVIISPGIFYTKQAKSSQFVGGLHANLNVSGNGIQQLLLGVYARSKDAIIPMVGYQWGNFKFSFSYDVTTSNLRNFNNSMGANEFYMQFDGIYNQMYGNRQSMCPIFTQ